MVIHLGLITLMRRKRTPQSHGRHKAGRGVTCRPERRCTRALSRDCGGFQPCPGGSPLSRLGRCKFALSATFTTNAHSTSWGWASLGTYDKKSLNTSGTNKTASTSLEDCDRGPTGGRSSGGPYGGDVLGRVLALLAHTPALRRIPAGLQGTPASLQSTDSRITTVYGGRSVYKKRSTHAVCSP